MHKRASLNGDLVIRMDQSRDNEIQEKHPRGGEDQEDGNEGMDWELTPGRTACAETAEDYNHRYSSVNLMLNNLYMERTRRNSFL